MFWHSHRSQVLSLFAAFLATVSPWLLFAFAYFGGVLPHSMTAKAVTLHPGIATSAAMYLSRFTTKITWRPLLDGFLLALTVVGTPLITSRPARAVLLWLGVYSAAYALSGVWIFDWYSGAAIPAYIITLGGAGVALGQRISMPRHVKYSGLAAAAILALTLVARLPGEYQSQRRGAVNTPSLNAYAEAGRMIRAAAHNGDNVAAPEIGAVGYHSRLPVLDMWALVSPQVVPFHRHATRDQAFTEILRVFKPAWYVTHSVWEPPALPRAIWFRAMYAPYARLRCQGGEVLVYRFHGSGTHP